MQIASNKCQHPSPFFNVDIAATFAGTEGDIAVAGKCHDYAVKTAEFVPAAIELAVGDIAVAEKTVTVQ